MPMISNELGVELHDRWTRGQLLTGEEQTQLELWYQQQDAQEAKQLNLVSTVIEISDLQVQIEMTLKQLATVIQRVQQITTENKALQQEIGILAKLPCRMR